MLDYKAVLGLMVITMVSSVTCSFVVKDRYEEKMTYALNPGCKPSTLDTGIECCEIGDVITVQGGLVSRHTFQMLKMILFRVSRFP